LVVDIFESYDQLAEFITRALNAGFGHARTVPDEKGLNVAVELEIPDGWGAGLAAGLLELVAWANKSTSDALLAEWHRKRDQD
jgi:hypothetical protein